MTGNDTSGEARGARWRQEPLRCPYCVQGNTFKAMIDLTGGAAGTFYCTTCRHLIRAAEPEFQCLCAHCRKNISMTS